MTFIDIHNIPIKMNTSNISKLYIYFIRRHVAAMDKLNIKVELNVTLRNKCHIVIVNRHRFRTRKDTLAAIEH